MKFGGRAGWRRFLETRALANVGEPVSPRGTLGNTGYLDTHCVSTFTQQCKERGMGVSLESMAIEMPTVFGHPNRVAFRGVLTFVDAVSDKAPAGARGHRVMLTRAAAEAAIPSLLGMALDYSPRLDGHDTRRKIGVITRAEIAGRKIAVAGFLYGRDFPEMVTEIGKAEPQRGKS